MSVVTKVRRFGGNVRRAYRDGGSAAAAGEGTRLLAAMVRHRVFRYREWRFDRSLRIDTRGFTELGAAAAASARHRDGLSYEPTRPRDFDRLVAALPLGAPAAAYTFVDLGCGKGRVLVMAACCGFGRVVGVELDDSLAEVARANLHAVCARRGRPVRDVHVLTMDAGSYELPPGPAVVYLYNPFGQDTVATVAANLQRSWRQHPRHLLVVYYNPVHQRLLERVPELRRVPGPAKAFWTVFATGGSPG